MKLTAPHRWMGRILSLLILATVVGFAVPMLAILLFGRHEECDVQLNSKKVSRRHCVVAQVNDTLVVRDLGSTNGVRVNGERVAEGKLKPGDELQIGNFKYQVCGDPLGRS